VTAETTLERALAHGLSAEEFARIRAILGRRPNLVELGIFAAMWSEHCSYKSSKVWLETLPTSGPRVICGPGENAGVVDIGDGEAVVFKMESHNHPSFIEPFQGAATGVGGILRDVFTMGARPIALLDSLRFGSPEHPRTRYLLGQVVGGIGFYGNCVGVPTVGGECGFDPAYDGNILVNAMCVGLARADRIFYSKASGPGNLVVYLGAKTGRDGIHGATMASAEFGADAGAQRPAVQVGDPFTEKLLLEACLELMASEAIVAIQDMGAAGLTSSAVEMAGKGALGIDLDLGSVPVREAQMSAYEIMLSESQERMLMILSPQKEAEARRILEKWELDFAVIGKLTESGRLVLRRGGAVAADVPIAPLSSEAPRYRRPVRRREPEPASAASALPAEDLLLSLERLLGSPDLCSKRWIWEQYDHLVQGNTVKRPGGDAAVIRVSPAGKSLALATDSTPRYCRADPVRGGAQAVAESWRNLTAVGALPLALTDCLNFGNPEKPEVMGEFAGVVAGMAEACRALDYPVVSGNVSFYNETSYDERSGEAILPTPVIGGVGLIADARTAVDLALKRDGDALVLVGETMGHLGASLYRSLIEGEAGGAPPPVDLAAERGNGDFVRAEIAAGRILACHDLADGGFLVALAEMAMAGGRGAAIAALPDDLPPAAYLFGEDQARYLVETGEPRALLEAAAAAGVAARRVGTVGRAALTLEGGHAISISTLKAANEAWLRNFMAQG
jgi:phosphoribosylformylglycinamidine synthase subunit PurL